MITALGSGSGLDLESIITQLMAIERQPIDALERRRSNLDVELSAFGQIKSALSTFGSAAETLGSRDSLGPYVAQSSDEDVLEITANGGSTSIDHDIVVSSLATQSRVESRSYTSSDDAVDQRTHTFTSGDNTFDVVVDGTNDTLAGLRDAINNSADNSSVDASILNVDDGAILIVTARQAGTDNEITVNSSGLLQPAEFSSLTTAEDAVFTVDGKTVTRSSNEISDVIDGVTLNLKSLGSASVSSERDTETLNTTLNDFAEQYNTLRTELTSQAEGAMQGDSLPRSIEASLRSVFSTPFELTNGETVSPLEVGFSFDRYGKLTVTDSEFSGAEPADMERFIEVFTRADEGIAARFEAVIEEYTISGGIIAGREDGIGSRKRSIDTQVDRMEYRLEKTETRLRAQYSAMDQLVAQLNNTSSYLASQLSSLSNDN